MACATSQKVRIRIEAQRHIVLALVGLNRCIEVLLGKGADGVLALVVVA